MFRRHWVIQGERKKKKKKKKKGGVPDWLSWEIRSASSPIPSPFNRRSDLRFVSSSASISLEAVELDDISDSIEWAFFFLPFLFFFFFYPLRRFKTYNGWSTA